MDTRKTPDDVLQSMLVEVRYFFLNDPYKKWKKVLCKFFTSSVYHGEDVASGKENSETLFMYERLREFLRDLHRLNEKMKEYDK